MTQFKSMTTLNHHHLLITRPAGQEIALKTALQHLGATVLTLPTMEIQPLPLSPTEQTHYHQLIHSADYVILISANAVKYSQSFAEFPNLTSPLIAVGPATANSIKQAGGKTVWVPKAYTSDGILALPELQQLNGQSIVLVCGDHHQVIPTAKATSILKKSADLKGTFSSEEPPPTHPLTQLNTPSANTDSRRRQLIQSLQARGATVHTVLCYRRQCPKYPLNKLHDITQQQFSVVVCTSRETLMHLYDLFNPHFHDWLCRQPLLVISQAMETQARELGFISPIYIADNATNEAIVSALIRDLKLKNK